MIPHASLSHVQPRLCLALASRFSKQARGRDPRQARRGGLRAARGRPPLPGAGPAGPPSDPASALLVAVTAVPFFACSYESCIIIIVVIVVVVMVTSTS